MLRDFAINMGKLVNWSLNILKIYLLIIIEFIGIVSGEAVLFADDVFHYEKRIVNHINLYRSSTQERVLNEIKTLAEIKTIAPSVNISNTDIYFL